MDHQNVQKQLPKIKFSQENLKLGTEKWVLTCKEVRSALEEQGCFVAVFDKIPMMELRDSIFSVADQLFSLPRETKARNISKTPFFGYVGDLSGRPLHESTGIEDSQTLESVTSFCKLMWPDQHHDFCGIIHEYAKMLISIEETVIRMIFESYGLGKKLCESYIDSTTVFLRFNSYRVPRINETSTGVKPHTDKSLLTILDQNQVNGLEVRLKDIDKWHPVDFQPSSFVIMAGEGLTAWSNNRIQPPIHQVTMNGKTTRYSMALFSYHKEIIHIPKELIDDEHPQCFKSFDHLGLVTFWANQFKMGRNSNLISIVSFCGV